jgi:hypothetical protein
MKSNPSSLIHFYICVVRQVPEYNSVLSYHYEDLKFHENFAFSQEFGYPFSKLTNHLLEILPSEVVGHLNIYICCPNERNS